MKITVGKMKIIHVGKTKQELVYTLNGKVLEQLSEFTYLVFVVFEDGKLVTEIEERRKTGAIQQLANDLVRW